MPGRHIHPFFVSSQITNDPIPATSFSHELTVQSATTIVYHAEVTSLIASNDTAYDCAGADNQTWIAAFVLRGRIPVTQYRGVLVAVAGTKPVVQTVSMRSKQDRWLDWDTNAFCPVIEAAI